jgi:hypothetical protein
MTYGALLSFEGPLRVVWHHYIYSRGLAVMPRHCQAQQWNKLEFIASLAALLTTSRREPNFYFTLLSVFTFPSSHSFLFSHNSSNTIDPHTSHLVSIAPLPLPLKATDKGDPTTKMIRIRSRDSPSCPASPFTLGSSPEGQSVGATLYGGGQ